MKVVIDTNCLIASIPPFGSYFWLYEAFLNKQFDWYVSNEILSEYEEQLTDFYSKKTADRVLKILTTAPNVVFAEPFYKWQIVEKDPDDNKFADLAIAVNAYCLVSNDKHFNVFKKIPFPKLLVVKLNDFKKKLGR